MTENNSEFVAISNQTDTSLFSLLFCSVSLLVEEIFQIIQGNLFGSDKNFSEFWGGTPFQCQVLKAFCVILVVNLILIAIIWHIYSQRISQTLASKSEIIQKNVKFFQVKD